ncbi:MAG: hypothetical protein Kilf2KO_06780 [Rhodospirillales bacterium]
MSVRDGHESASRVDRQFRQAAAKPTSRKKRAKLPPPVSIRFTYEERARLNRDTGMLSVAAYIRLKLFSDDNIPHPGKSSQTKNTAPLPNWRFSISCSGLSETQKWPPA